MGMEKMEKRKPRAWDAPDPPTRSKAMGPSRQMKRPSHRPINRQITTSEMKLHIKYHENVSATHILSAASTICECRLHITRHTFKTSKAIIL